MIPSERLKSWISNSCAVCAAILLLLYLTLPQDASPEYDYTVSFLMRRVFPFVLLAAFVSRDSVSRVLFSLSKKYKFMGIVGIAVLSIPLLAPSLDKLSWQMGYLLSACWMIGALCSALVIFAVAAKINNLFSGGLCLIGSLALAFSVMEGYLLLTSQPQDALLDDSHHSKYVLSNQAAPISENLCRTAVGTFPKAAGSPVFTAHRELKFDRVLFDVRYGFDAQGRRVTPASDGTPLAEVLLFGCSFTFGYGLEDNETWPWQLGELLGPKWRVSNYAYNGFGPQQMLTLLEEGLIEAPVSSKRAALFLAIEGQIPRNAGLLFRHSIRYALRDDGHLERDGFTTDSPYTILFLLPGYFNGSQLVRHLSGCLTQFFVKRHHDDFVKSYLAILEESARLLREKYNTPLTILLWPDVEYLEAELQQRGIATLRARSLLPDWDTAGDAYCIDPRWERHPSSKATRELAEGPAAYFRQSATQKEGV